MTTVRMTRPRHPLQGRELQLLGRMRRHGRLELLLVLPDGSKSLIPAAWTDLGDGAGAAEAGTLGLLEDLLACHALVTDLAARVAQAIEAQQAARQSSCEEDTRAACAAQSDAGTGSGATSHADRPASGRAGRRRACAAGGVDRQGRHGRGEAGGGR
ncbi:DUF5372 family protein [Dactylosporangium darangshiense]|uniref:DUF5372 family protein n=1 Tax=Dactylosporangium darangshiense TaxID=579108 RepID=UPI0031E82E9D